MSIYGEKGTLSAQQDCRSEWTLLRSEQTNTHRYNNNLQAGRKKPLTQVQVLTPTGWPLFSNGQPEQTLMHNEYISGRPICHGLCISPLSASLLLLQFVLSCRAQLWVLGNRLDSLLHFLCHVYATAVTSISSHRLFLCVSSLDTHMHTHPQGRYRAAAILDGHWSVTWVSVLSQRCDMGCHLRLNDLQALEVKMSLWCCAQSSVLSLIFSWFRACADPFTGPGET